MRSCRIDHYMLLLLLLMFITVSVSDVPAVTVKLHDSATLSCSERCSGLVRWTEFSKPTVTLAECDQTSCRSVKEGYQMIHHQYLNGDLSLTITDADFRKRALYTCDCDGKDLCEVQLKIEPVNTTVHLKSGEPLVLDLDVSDPVEVLYDSTGAAGPSSVQICKGDEHQLQINPEYKHRASAAFELRAVTPSDSGVYTIRDTRNEEVLRIYSVIVRDDSDAQRRNHRTNETCCSDPPDQGAAVPAWMMVVMVVMVAALMLCGVLVVVCVRQRRVIQLQTGSVGRGGGGGNQNGIQMNEQRNHKPEEQEPLSSPNNNLQHV